MSMMVKKTEILEEIYLTQRAILKEYRDALFDAICEDLAVDLFEDEPEASKFYRDLPHNLKELPKKPAFNGPMKRIQVSDMVEDEKNIVISIYLGPESNHKTLFRKYVQHNMLSAYNEVYGDNSEISQSRITSRTIYGMNFKW